MKLVKYQRTNNPKVQRVFNLDIISDNDLRSYGWLPYQEPARIYERPVKVETPKVEEKAPEEQPEDISIPEIKATPKKRTPRKTTTKPKQ